MLYLYVILKLCWEFGLGVIGVRVIDGWLWVTMGDREISKGSGLGWGNIDSMVTSSFRLGSVRMLEGGFRSNKGLVGVCGSEEGCRDASKSELVGVLRSEGTCVGSSQSELVGVLRSEGGWAGSAQSELEEVHAFVVVGVVSVSCMHSGCAVR